MSDSQSTITTATEILKIVLLSVAASIVYGVLHDQVTARVCVEYFTIGHPPVFDTESPTLLACGWGVIATWWLGALLGVPAALLAQLGSWPKFSAAMLVRPIGILLAIMAIGSLLAGIGGYFAAKANVLTLPPPFDARIPTEKHVAFLADGCAHEAAYTIAAFGGGCLWGWIVYRRKRMARQLRLQTAATTPQ